VATASRLFADRRNGVDRRSIPRRETLARVARERRRLVDRRRGTERRSTLDRRCHPTRHRTTEAPGEHVRNALQLLAQLEMGLTEIEHRADLEAAVKRLQHALFLLERRTRE
jgi:hypothetical protein